MIGIAVAAVAASFGAVRAPDRADASCMEIVVWHDVAYAGPWNPANLPPIDTGRHLRGAVEPDCADTGGPAAAPTPVQASSIDGVPPSVAIWAFGGPLIASGYFPRQPGFPIALAGRAVDDETVGCRLGDAVTVDGKAEAGFGGLAVVVSRSSEPLRLIGGRVLPLFLDVTRGSSGHRARGCRTSAGGKRCTSRLAPVRCRVRWVRRSSPARSSRLARSRPHPAPRPSSALTGPGRPADHGAGLA